MVQDKSGTRMPTGIAGFDEISDGGLPRGRLTVVLGAAGAGKTVFGMQVLARGGHANAEAAILVAFEESAGRILANVEGFRWAESARDVAVLDAQLSQAVEHAGEFDLLGLLAIVDAKAAQIGAKRVVFDGLDVMLGYLGDASLIRREAFRIRDWVHTSGLTTIVTAKADASAQAGAEYDFLQYMADCVVTLHHRLVHGTALRFVRILKYRGAAHSANEFPFAITGEGIEVAGNTTIELAYPVSRERVPTGIERLDAMLAGGYYRGTSVLITGAPGTAKTSLAAAFAEAAARRGERTAFVSFDEAPDQIVRNVSSIGIDLAPHVASGLLRIYSLRGRLESPEAQVARIRALLLEVEPQNLVIDPLSAVGQQGDEAHKDVAALQILDLAKRSGITTVNTSLLGGAHPLTEQTQLNVSTIADTWMHVSYVSHGGERNRALTIVKARGTGHSNQVRELVLSDQGVTLADVYAVDGEVLMGTLRWERENQDRRSRTLARHTAIVREQKAELALAEMTAQQGTLSRARAIQEAELAQARIDAMIETERRAVEADELLVRRDADPSPEPAHESKLTS